MYFQFLFALDFPKVIQWVKKSMHAQHSSMHTEKNTRLIAFSVSFELTDLCLLLRIGSSFWRKMYFLSSECKYYKICMICHLQSYIYVRYLLLKDLPLLLNNGFFAKQVPWEDSCFCVRVVVVVVVRILSQRILLFRQASLVLQTLQVPLLNIAKMCWPNVTFVSDLVFLADHSESSPLKHQPIH